MKRRRADAPHRPSRSFGRKDEKAIDYAADVALTTRIDSCLLKLCFAAHELQCAYTASMLFVGHAVNADFLKSPGDGTRLIDGIRIQRKQTKPSFEMVVMNPVLFGHIEGDAASRPTCAGGQR